MRKHCTDQRDLDGDRARSGLQAAVAASRPAICARVRRSWCRSRSCAMRSRADLHPRSVVSAHLPSTGEGSFCRSLAPPASTFAGRRARGP